MIPHSYPSRKKMTLLLGATALVLVMVMGALVWASSPAQAASLTVTTTNDELNTDGDCSLREAVEAANTNAAVDACAAGSDTERDAIVFAVGQGATITLNPLLGALLITDDAGLTIDGQTNNITISGGDAMQVFQVNVDAVFTLSKLTVADGNTFNGGGLFNNRGKVKVANSTFSGNSASGGSGGGAIVNAGKMTVTKSTFSDNSTSGTGGGIDNNGKLKVANSTFSNNSAAGFGGGGGIFNNGSIDIPATMTVTKSTFSGNHATGGNGGGITNHNFGMLEITKSTISGNDAAVRPDSQGATGKGGGIFQSGGTLKVINSTIFGNSARSEGGGIFTLGGTLEVTNSTISKNSAEVTSHLGGGGILVAGPDNTLKNTIVANSTQGGNCKIVGSQAALTDGGYNIDDGTSCGFSTDNDSQPSTDPLLASSLADNGGPTLTLKLRSGSPAINAIPNTVNGCGTEITTDQRGVSRPQGDGCDIGSFEKKEVSTP